MIYDDDAESIKRVSKERENLAFGCRCKKRDESQRDKEDQILLFEENSVLV